MRLSARAQRIQPSLTLSVTARAVALRKSGVDVIPFGAGEPDFDTPAFIKAAAVTALDRGATKYTAVGGMPELRAAAAAELSRVHGVAYAPEQIVVSTGAKQCLYNIFMALCDEGDEVIVPTPCWVSHTEIIQIAGGTPVPLPLRAEDGFALDVDGLERRLGPRTRALLLSSPTNPTGAVYSAEAMEGVARLLRAHPQVVLVTDDLYRSLVYGEARWISPLATAPDLYERTVVVDGVSKAYAMTGWRIGYSAGPRWLVPALENLQGQTTTHATTVAQHAALAALTGGAPVLAEVERMRVEFDRRRLLMLEALRQIPDLTCAEPLGAFYCFPRADAYLNRPGGPRDDVELADHLLSRAHVAVVPGSGFFAPGHLRLSYATSAKNVAEGMRRIARALGELGGAA